MPRITPAIVSSLAVLLLAGALDPVAANAWSFSKKTKSDASAVKGQGTNIVIQVYNRGLAPQDIKMDGQTYTMQPPQSLSIKGMSGTAVYADTTGNGYQKGELLFKLAPNMNGGTVKFN